MGISSGFCYHVVQKVYIFGKIFKLRPRDQFGLATPILDVDLNFPSFQLFIIEPSSERSTKHKYEDLKKNMKYKIYPVRNDRGKLAPIRRIRSFNFNQVSCSIFLLRYTEVLQ